MRPYAYFDLYLGKAGKAYFAPVVQAYRVKSGDTIAIDWGWGETFQIKADQDGWRIKSADESVRFLSDKDLKKCLKPISVVGTHKFPEGGTVTPVLKGETVLVYPYFESSSGVQIVTGSAGYLVQLPDNDMKPIFMSDIDYRSYFVTDAIPLDPEAEQGLFKTIIKKGTRPIRFIIVQEDVVLDFEDGPRNAEKGWALFENENDVDGYTLVPRDFFTLHLDVVKPYGDTPVVSVLSTDIKLTVG